jgi:hypothetical protein
MIIRNKISQLVLFLFSLVVLSSCGPASIEEQIEKLIESEDYSERKEIAYALADSLDNRAAELLIGAHSMPSPTSDYSMQALKDMLDRYSEQSNSYESDKVDGCISYITNPNPTHDLTNQEKIDLIIHGLKLENTDGLLAPNLDFQKSLSNSALKHGRTAMLNIISEWNLNQSTDTANSAGLLFAILSFKDDAINFLSEKIAEDQNAIELLAQIGEPAVQAMKIKMTDDKQSVRFAAGDVLVRMLKYHPDAILSLTSAIDNSGVSTIAKNYPFYIRLGQINTEQILLKALNQNFTLEMCEDYLNCGNQLIEDGASDIAYDYGYIVTPGFGDHYGPKWGSGN